MNFFASIPQFVVQCLTAHDYALTVAGMVAATVLAVGGMLVMIVKDEN